VGNLVTLPAFTSVTLDDKVASGFGDHLMFTFTRVRGVRIRALSAMPQEAEVLVPPPSVHRILAVAMFHGSLVVTLECAESPLSYLFTSSPALHVTHAPLSAPSPVAKAAPACSWLRCPKRRRGFARLWQQGHIKRAVQTPKVHGVRPSGQ
jgi:hypothetical protein